MRPLDDASLGRSVPYSPGLTQVSAGVCQIPIGYVAIDIIPILIIL